MDSTEETNLIEDMVTQDETIKRLKEEINDLKEQLKQSITVDKIKEDIAAYKSQRDLCKRIIDELISMEEQECMDKITYYRTKRQELNRLYEKEMMNS